MNSYVAYIDLLGIKDMAKYSVEAYYNAISSFTHELAQCTDVFKKDGYRESSVYYFSDCAFIQCENLDALFSYMINLRYRLILNSSPLMFTAAIGVNISGQAQALEKPDDSEFINGISFANKDICSVYVLQNNFKGIGIFIDDQVLIEWEKTLRDKHKSFDKEQYISKSFFFPTIYSQNPVCYYDLKLTKPELKTVYFENVLRRYHSADFKNKKYGRFYLSYLANWIVSELYYCKQEGRKLLFFSYLIGDDDYIIGNLRKHAYKFDFLLFFLLNEFINLGIDRTCPEEFLSLVKYIISSTTTKKYLNDLTLQVPESILSNENKDKFIDTYQKMLLQRKSAEKKTKKKEEL